MQIVNAVSVLQKLPEMAYNCLQKGTEAYDLYYSLSENSSEDVRNVKRVFLSGSCYRIGHQWKKKLSQEQKNALQIVQEIIHSFRLTLMYLGVC